MTEVDDKKPDRFGTPLIDRPNEWERISGPVGAVSKRVIDLSISTVMLIVLAPLLLAIAIAVRLDSPGGTFFKQERVGYRGKDFQQWKFRSMVSGAMNMGLGVNVAENDDRITRVGAFLRKTSLDELPNLVNVLKGDMSLVGPRPTLRYQVNRYTPDQLRRLSAKPGVTGLAAIRGRNAIPWIQRMAYDVEYIENWSLWRDIAIIALTPWSLWANRNTIYGEGGVNDDFGGVTEHASVVGNDKK